MDLWRVTEIVIELDKHKIYLQKLFLDTDVLF